MGIEAIPGVRASSATCRARPGIGNASVPSPGAAAADTRALSVEVVVALCIALMLRATPRTSTAHFFDSNALLQRLLASRLWTLTLPVRGEMSSRLRLLAVLGVAEAGKGHHIADTTDRHAQSPHNRAIAASRLTLKVAQATTVIHLRVPPRCVQIMSIYRT